MASMSGKQGFEALTEWLKVCEEYTRKKASTDMSSVVQGVLICYCAAKQLAPQVLDEGWLRQLEARFYNDARRLRAWGFDGIWENLDQLLDKDRTTKLVNERKRELGAKLGVAVEPEGIPTHTPNPFEASTEPLIGEFGNLKPDTLDGGLY